MKLMIKTNKKVIVGLSGGVDPENRAAYPWGREDKELVAFFKGLGKEYHSHSALKIGSFEPLYLNENVFSFIRRNPEETILVLSNRTSEQITVNYYEKQYEAPAFRTIYYTL